MLFRPYLEIFYVLWMMKVYDIQFGVTLQPERWKNKESCRIYDTDRCSIKVFLNKASD
jgi:hypothetical protein